MYIKGEDMKQYDVVALGELLIDFIENGKSEQGNSLFEANPGGAPCNVLAMLSKLGHKTAFIGKVGNDLFGVQLKKAIESVGIDSKYLCMDNQVNTTLAFVKNNIEGDREFSFYRNPGADMMLVESDISEEVIKQAKIFHFGTLSMTHDNVRKATKKAISIAEKNKVIISFDPNLRFQLWDSLSQARNQVLYGLEHCNVLKISDNEIQWLTGESDFTKGVKWIYNRYQTPLIFVSMGKQGSRVYYDGKMMVDKRPFLQKNTIDTTGAGDTFYGCVLHYICKKEDIVFTKEQFEEMLTFANAAASIIITKKGALSVMPDYTDICQLIEKNKE